MSDWKMPTNWRDITPRKLNELAGSHPGRIAHLRWQEWHTIRWAAIVNEQQLLAHTARPGEDKDLALELIQNVRNDRVRQLYFAELYRLLHNYLASVKALVDHSRRLVDGYTGIDGSTFVDEYRSQTGQLAGNPVVAFVHDLRNVLTHQRLPGLGVTVSIPDPQADPGRVLADIFFIRDELLQQDRMGAKAKVYLRAQAEQFPLPEPVAEYASSVGQVTEWLSSQFDRLHGRQLAEYNEVVEHLRGDFGEGSTGQN